MLRKNFEKIENERFYNQILKSPIILPGYFGISLIGLGTGSFEERSIC
jgi:hypothetical protein